MADNVIQLAIEAVNDTRPALDEVIQDLDRLQGAMDRLGGSDASAVQEAISLPLADASATLALLGATMSETVGQVGEQFGALEAVVEALAGAPAVVVDAINSLPGQTQAATSTLVKRFGELAAQIGAATGKVNQLRAAINRLPDSKVITVRAVFSGAGGGVSSEAGGGDFITTRPTLIMVGDNPGGRERVQVTPLSGRGRTRISPNSGLIRAAGGLESSLPVGDRRGMAADFLQEFTGELLRELRYNGLRLSEVD